MKVKGVQCLFKCKKRPKTNWIFSSEWTVWSKWLFKMELIQEKGSKSLLTLCVCVCRSVRGGLGPRHLESFREYVECGWKWMRAQIKKKRKWKKNRGERRRWGVCVIDRERASEWGGGGGKCHLRWRNDLSGKTQGGERVKKRTAKKGKRGGRGGTRGSNRHGGGAR